MLGQRDELVRGDERAFLGFPPQQAFGTDQSAVCEAHERLEVEVQALGRKRGAKPAEQVHPVPCGFGQRRLERQRLAPVEVFGLFQGDPRVLQDLRRGLSRVIDPHQPRRGRQAKWLSVIRGKRSGEHAGDASGRDELNRSEQGEEVSPNPSQAAAVPESGGQPSGHGLQHLVAEGVVQNAVDVRKVVQVDEGHRAGPWPALLERSDEGVPVR